MIASSEAADWRSPWDAARNASVFAGFEEGAARAALALQRHHLAAEQ
jgi:hypothetical protein